MIGGMILLGFFLYWLIAKKIVGMVYAETQSIIKKCIAIVIFILIPTWDIILGFPIYAYLCATQAGVKIYKTVENVEGFYVGEKTKNYEPYQPYDGYRYIDYKEQESGKYYRSYWLDNNTSDLCVPVGIYRYSNYAEAVAKGKCIAKEEIKEGDVSRLWFDSNSMERQTKLRIIPLLDFTHHIPLLVQDTTSSQTLGQLDYYWWQGGWVYGIISSIEVGSGGMGCGFIDNTPEITFMNAILKPKQGVSHGNN